MEQILVTGAAGRAEGVPFDFADPATYPEAFQGVDRLFLLRPPQAGDVERFLFPVVDYALGRGVRQIVFLSLQCAEFNVFTPHHKVEQYLPAGRGRTAFIDTRDIGAVAARVFTEDGHAGRAYTLNGLEALDYFQLAQTLSAVLDRAVRYADPSVRDYVARLRAQKTAEDFIRVQKMLYLAVRYNLSANTRSDAEVLLGRRPVSLAEFIEHFQGAWL